MRMRAEERHLAGRQFFFGCTRLDLDASPAAEAVSLCSTTGPSAVEASRIDRREYRKCR
jgi:hypothetical protein